jgi:hypothetical protein
MHGPVGEATRTIEVRLVAATEAHSNTESVKFWGQNTIG